MDTKLTGGVLGSVIGATAREAAALSGDKNYSTNFFENLSDSFNSLRDPLWKLKQDELVTQVQGSRVALQDRQLKLDSLKAENQAWMADAPKFSEWQKFSLEDKLKNPIVATSQRGTVLANQMNQSAWRNFQAQENAKAREENSAIARDREKTIREFDGAVAEDPELMASIAKLPGYGYTMTPQGQRLAPTPEAIALVNAYRARNNMPRFGISTAESKERVQQDIANRQKSMEVLKETNRESLQKLKNEKQNAFEKAMDDVEKAVAAGDPEREAFARGQIKKLNFTPDMTQEAMQVRQQNVLKQREDFTLALEDIRQSGKIKIEELRTAAKAATKRDLTEKDFITKNAPMLTAKLIAQGKDPEEAGRTAKLVLHGLYKGLDKPAPAAPAPASVPSAGTNAPIATPPTNAPAGDPLQLFK